MATTETSSIIARAQLRSQEIATLRALAVHGDTGEAAAHLGVVRSTVQTRLWRIRACLAVVTGQQHWTVRELADLARKDGLVNGGGDDEQ